MRYLVTLVCGVLLVACATSPLGRRQLQLFPHAQMVEMGATAYSKVKQETPIDRDPQVNRYVECVARAITSQLGSRGNLPSSWEVTVFRENEANAFALPGGKIGVYSGLLKVAETQGQLATVIGHEVAHVLSGHANERVSTTFATQTGLDLIAVLAGGSSADRQNLMGLLGLGAQVGVLLPFSRAQESEADLLGLDLMARAGFDPHQSVALWKNMERQGGGSPPAFLSTHPSHDTRIRDLERRMPHAVKLYQEARAAGRVPQCGSP